jgi:hypothetical protein
MQENVPFAIPALQCNHFVSNCAVKASALEHSESPVEFTNVYGASFLQEVT